MTEYAKGTEVSVEKSRAEIERILTRYGADQFMYGWKQESSVIAFRAKGRHVRFVLPMPNKEERRFTHLREDSWTTVPVSTQQKRYEQACRENWRALTLCIKAKLEAVNTGISQFEDEFMAQIVLPNGQTMSEHAKPLIEAAYRTGTMPALLPHLP